MKDCLQSSAPTTVTLFFSCPGDVHAEKEQLVRVVEEMRPAFIRHGIVLRAWTFEQDSVPSVLAPGESIQTVVDRQMPRKPDGSIAVDLFVGLMDRRIGTKLKDAPSGTVHEFLEARESFEATGRPHILFYFRERSYDEAASDIQMEGVLAFRAQYPGLFGTYDSILDLEDQFRRHLLMQLLDLLHSGESVPFDPAARTSWQDINRQYSLVSGRYSATPMDRSPAKARRILRQLHLLFGIENRLQPHERHTLGSAILSRLLNPDDRAQFEAFAGQALGNAQDIHDVVARSSGEQPLAGYIGSAVRIDLLAVFVMVGLRLDLMKQSLQKLDLQALKEVDDWVAFLTADIVCERGVVRFHLLAPSPVWVDPLTGATAVALESLWQYTRTILTKHGFSFGVARCRVELDSQLGSLPASALDFIESRAKEAVDSLPSFPHFSEAKLPALDELLPLPFSKVQGPISFRAPRPGVLRLRENGAIVAEGAESTVIERYAPPGRISEYILECDEAGEFIPVVQCLVQPLTDVERAVLDCASAKPEALRTLELWNDLLELIWPGLLSKEAAPDDLSTAFHFLRNAFDKIGSFTAAPLERRDLYWDALETVRKQLAGKSTFLHKTKTQENT